MGWAPMRVGICLERSLDLLVGVLGILRPVGPMSRWTPRSRPSAWPSC
jgi:hypothetical protein